MYINMKNAAYIQFNKAQLDKIGYTIVYLSTRIPQLSKTKLLKLLYILDEISIKKGGIPFLNLTYKLWKLGPVSKELFIDLSSEPKLLESFIERHIDGEKIYIKPKILFVDDEFSDNDIELIDYVIDKYGSETAKDLVSYTHRLNSPWYNTAIENNVLELLKNESINSTDYSIDMSQLISHDRRKKEVYFDYLESH